MTSPKSEYPGMTLPEYAAARQKRPAAVREDYRRLMRAGEGLDPPAPTRVRESGELRKFCLPAGTADGRDLETESVIIPMSGHRGESWRTICISSQVGCKMGCTFCETGRMGLLQNLTAARIVVQRIAARQILGLNAARLADVSPWRYDSDGIRNIVFMGMGEPLDNFDAVIQAIRVFNDPAGLNIPHSQITVSTVGRIDGLKRLAALGWRNLRIAVSLNAAHDGLRNELMPVNRNMPLCDLQRALIDYPLAPKGVFMIEYVLIKGVNDSPADADLVAEWCRPLRCAVNLIPYNPQAGASFESPHDDVVYAFLTRLRERGQFVKWRRTQGRDLMGACGQLGNPEFRRGRKVPCHA
jgi:23S rRNA (adenine2503-C2)-methyltransferase